MLKNNKGGPEAANIDGFNSLLFPLSFITKSTRNPKESQNDYNPARGDKESIDRALHPKAR